LRQFGSGNEEMMDEQITVAELLDVAEAFDFEAMQLADWWKIGGDRGPRVYVKKAKANGVAREVHLSGFTLNRPEVRQITLSEATAMHLGKVQGIINVQTAAGRANVIQLFEELLDELAKRTSTSPPSHPDQGQELDIVIPDRLLGFQGYGRLDAPLWFLGIEEGFGRRLSNPGWDVQRELEVRAQWTPVMDARAAHLTLDDRYWERRNYSMVWRNAAKLARGIVLGQSDWRDTDLAHDYVVASLGRTTGDTFLGELFPLPAVGIEEWPYSGRWKVRAEYRSDTWSSRLHLWQSLLADSPAKAVICYGSAVRKYANELFNTQSTTGIRADNIGGKRVVFAPFIGGRCSGDVLAILQEAVLA
jgi:hypothetical protein